MILNYDHYRTGQKRRGRRALLIPVLAGILVLGVALFFVLRIPARLSGGTVERHAPGKLPDLFRAEK